MLQVMPPVGLTRLTPVIRLESEPLNVICFVTNNLRVCPNPIHFIGFATLPESHNSTLRQGFPSFRGFRSIVQYDQLYSRT